MKNLSIFYQSRAKCTVCITYSIFAFTFFLVFCPKLNSAEENSINLAAARSCLEQAVKSYSEEKWDDAFFQAQLGSVYKPNAADFFYLMASAGIKLQLPYIDILKNAEIACGGGMEYMFYNKDSSMLLCAEVYCKMTRYHEALSILNSIRFASADKDFIHALAFYGLGMDTKAENIISAALSRWSLDSRFAKLFFLKERGKKINIKTKKLASDIISRLYVWQDSDPGLLVFASPFEVKSAENIRRLKIFRSMYIPFSNFKSFEEIYVYSYSILLCLRYGIINEQTAVAEFLNIKMHYKNPFLAQEKDVHVIYDTHLEELLRLLVNRQLREKIRSFLAAYEGLVLADLNNDLILNSKVYYKDGRPFFGEFDNSQEGYPDYSVEFNFGIPKKVYGKNNSYSAVYDEYPNLKTFTKNDDIYVLRPLALKWPILKFHEMDLKLYREDEKQQSFFTVYVDTDIEKLHDAILLYSCAYTETPEHQLEEATLKTFFDNGERISSIVFFNSNKKIYSEMNYLNGVPALKNVDGDGDGYFETKIEYDVFGKMKNVSIDYNKNKFYEYTEAYNTDGSIIKKWDSDENGKYEIIHTQYTPKDFKTEWTHPVLNKQISVVFEDGVPVSLYDGGKIAHITADVNNKIYWIGGLPELLPNELNKTLVEVFNQNDMKVVSYMFTVNELTVYAVKSGGFIFAEIIDK